MVIPSPVPSSNNDPLASSAGHPNESVTLTKAQLQAILRTVNNENDVLTGTETLRNRHHSLPSLNSSDEDCTAIKNLYQIPQINRPDEIQLNRYQPLPPINSSQGLFERNQIPVDENIIAQPEVPKYRNPPSTLASSLNDLPKQAPAVPPQPSNLSRLEKKRLQWEKEKAEMKEWNPWGKPGAGAPLKNHYAATKIQKLDPNTEEDNPGSSRNMQHAQTATPLPSAKRSEEKSFTRGLGSLTLAGDTPEEIQERRQRALEYQKEIEKQMEEAKKRRAEEKERKLREEQEEELKLELERKRLQQEYEQEQERQKMKEEQKQKKRELLIVAMQEAQASAEAAKRASKQKKFPSPTHSSCYSEAPIGDAPNNHYASFSSPQSKEERLASSPTTNDSHYPLPPSSEPQISHQSSPPHRASPLTEVYSTPFPKSSTSFSDKREFAVQANLEPPSSSRSGYVENRILTPSKLRIRSRYAGSLPSNLHCICQSKDFATQTDPSYLVGKWVRREEGRYLGSEESSNESPSHRQNSFSFSKPPRRVQHSKPTRVTTINHRTTSISLYSDVPPSSVNKWASEPLRPLENGKPHLTSSFYKRKKLQEMRKQHWEREMATQQKKGIMEVSHHSQAMSFSPSSEESYENSLETDSIPVRSPSPTSLRNGYARPTSPPVPALQKKLGLDSSQYGSTISVSYPARQQQSPNNATTQSTLAATENSHCTKAPETRPKSPPVPALRKKLENATRNPTECRFPQPVSTASIRKQWSHSTENLPAIPGPDQRYSLPLQLVQSLSSSSGSSSSGSCYGRSPIRRRWHSQDNFHPENMLAKSPSLTTVIGLHPREHLSTAPPTLTLPSKNLGTNARRKWETDHENLDILHKTFSSNPISDNEDEENVVPKTHVDPLINPDLVKGRPTPRQDRILQQLTDLRQGLLKKQKELESLLRPSSNSS